MSRTAAIQRQLLPALLSEFADAPEPDRGLLGYRQVSEKLGTTPWYLRLLRDEILPQVNLFCYGQVESPYGSGEFYRVLEESFGSEHESLVLSEIENKEGIYESIKKFLGKGK